MNPGLLERKSAEDAVRAGPEPVDWEAAAEDPGPESSIIHSLDDVTMVELQNLADELQHEYKITKEEAEDDEQIDSSKNNGGSCSKDNEVSEQEDLCAYPLADLYQLITSKLGSMVHGKSLIVVIHSYPMAWNVQRLDIDFVTLWNYLVKKNPQVIIPPLPMVNQKKKLSKKQLAKNRAYYQKRPAL